MLFPVEQVLHLRWDAPPFSPRGNSLVLPAFQSIELLRDYRKAEQAIAKRWATPFRLIKVGGAYAKGLVTPEQKQLHEIRDMVNKMDMKSGLVVPFYVNVETHGAEGSVLNVEEKVREVKEDIIVALGLSRSLVTGDGPNFATASVSMQKMLVMIREIKQVARHILDWVINDWLTISGHDEATVQYLFNDLDPSDAVEFKKLLLDLYDRKLISRSSLQVKMELDPDVEAANRTQEKVSVDQLDDKQIKPIADLVTLGVLDAEEARGMLGLKPRAQTDAAVAARQVGDHIAGNAAPAAARFMIHQQQAAGVQPAQEEAGIGTGQRGRGAGVPGGAAVGGDGLADAAMGAHEHPECAIAAFDHHVFVIPAVGDIGTAAPPPGDAVVSRCVDVGEALGRHVIALGFVATPNGRRQQPGAVGEDGRFIHRQAVDQPARRRPGRRGITGMVTGHRPDAQAAIEEAFRLRPEEPQPATRIMPEVRVKTAHPRVGRGDNGAWRDPGVPVVRTGGQHQVVPRLFRDAAAVPDGPRVARSRPAPGLECLASGERRRRIPAPGAVMNVGERILNSVGMGEPHHRQRGS